MTLDQFIQQTLHAVEGQQWWLLASTLVVAVTMAFRVLLAAKVKFLAWFNTNRGGVVAAAFFTIAGGFAHATTAGQAPDLAFWFTVLKVFLGAVGQYVSIRKLITNGVQKTAAGGGQ